MRHRVVLSTGDFARTCLPSGQVLLIEGTDLLRLTSEPRFEGQSALAWMHFAGNSSGDEMASLYQPP